MQSVSQLILNLQEYSLILTLKPLIVDTLLAGHSPKQIALFGTKAITSVKINLSNKKTHL